jgi:hypothetical protein
MRVTETIYRQGTGESTDRIRKQEDKRDRQDEETLNTGETEKFRIQEKPESQTG